MLSSFFGFFKIFGWVSKLFGGTKNLIGINWSSKVTQLVIVLLLIIGGTSGFNWWISRHDKQIRQEVINSLATEAEAEQAKLTAQYQAELAVIQERQRVAIIALNKRRTEMNEVITDLTNRLHEYEDRDASDVIKDAIRRMQAQ